MYMYVCLYLRKGANLLLVLFLFGFDFYVVCLARDVFFLPERIY